MENKPDVMTDNSLTSQSYEGVTFPLISFVIFVGQRSVKMKVKYISHARSLMRADASRMLTKTNN